MKLERLVHGRQVRLESLWHIYFIRVHALDLMRQPNQIRQFAAVAFVKMHQDILDERRDGSVLPVDTWSCDTRLDLTQDLASINATVAARVRNRALAPAAEVELVLPKDATRRRVPERHVREAIGGFNHAHT
jgi:hypothetical protein